MPTAVAIQPGPFTIALALATAPVVIFHLLCAAWPGPGARFDERSLSVERFATLRGGWCERRVALDDIVEVQFDPNVRAGCRALSPASAPGVRIELADEALILECPAQPAASFAAALAGAIEGRSLEP